MVKRVSLVVALVLVGAFPTVSHAEHSGGDAGGAINNAEQRVTDHAFRTGALQDKPDVSGDVLVWRDKRGDSDQPYQESELGPHGHLWSKDLGTRDESLVKEDLATDDANPRVSGSWVVWTDHTPGPGGDPGNDDIYACLLPCTPDSVEQVTSDPHHQMNPAISGTTVVWEDYRNAGNPYDPNDPDGVDIFKKDLSDLAAPETPVVEAPGNQTSPSISIEKVGKKGPPKTTIAWRDSRDVDLPGFSEADVWVRVGNAAPTQVAHAAGNARSLSAFQVAVSGARLLWNEPDPACSDTGASDCESPKILKTCALGGGGCGAVSPVDSVPSAPDSFGMVTDLDLSGSQAVWSRATDAGNHAYTVDLATCDGACDPLLPIDDLEHSGAAVAPRVDGQRFAWAQVDRGPAGNHQDSDVFWRDLTTQPRRANSIGLGRFGSHGSPAADDDLVVYRRTPLEQPGTDDVAEAFQVWATDLDGPRRHFPVSTVLGTDSSRPAIAGARVVWSECLSVVGFDSCGPVFERTLTDPEPAEVTDLSKLGPPDADGASTAWRCGDTEVCVHDGTSLESVDVSGALLDSNPTTAEFSVVGELVRIAGDHVAWHEFFFSTAATCEVWDPCPQDTRLHVLNATTGDDVVVADDLADFPEFDIDESGGTTTVVWSAGGDTLYSTDTTCAGDPFDCPAPFVTVPGHTLSMPSIDDGRVAWIDCVAPAETTFGPCDGPADIYTRTLGEVSSHLVTNETDTINQWDASPYVDGDRIYWVDYREGGADVYRESVAPADGVTPDTGAPSKPTDVVAARLGNGIELSWTNPTDNDFVRVRVLRKSGSAPSGIDDTSASVLYEGSGTTFTDTDVTPGVTYHYEVFAFDFEPNFSPGEGASATA